MNRNALHEAIAKYLIEGYEAGELTKEMDARELHLTLRVREQFNTWFHRKVKLGNLTRGEDYLFLPGTIAFDRKYAKAYNFGLSGKAVLKIASLEKNLIGQRIKEYLEILQDKETEKAG